VVAEKFLQVASFVYLAPNISLIVCRTLPIGVMYTNSRTKGGPSLHYLSSALYIKGRMGFILKTVAMLGAIV